MNNLEVKRTALKRAQQRARCVVQSWLSSWGVPFECDGRYLVVDGKVVAISSRVDYQSAVADVTLYIQPLLGRNFDASMAEIRRLMDAVERVMPTPPRRPPAGRATSDDYLARSMRLSQFSRSPNLPEAAIEPYKSTLKREADRAWRRYGDLTRILLMDPKDYYSIGMVFLYIYLSRLQDLDNEKRNGANLCLFLQQEFNRWAKVTRKDMRSITPDTRGVMVSQMCSAPVPGASMEWRGSCEEPSYTVPEYLEVEEPAKCAPKMSIADARKAVTSALAAMPHDEMVEKLSCIIRNSYLDHDTRRAATLRFNRHLAECEACRVTEDAWKHVHITHRKYQMKSQYQLHRNNWSQA